jgi:hypothetical protein
MPTTSYCICQLLFNYLLGDVKFAPPLTAFPTLACFSTKRRSEDRHKRITCFILSIKRLHLRIAFLLEVFHIMGMRLHFHGTKKKRLLSSWLNFEVWRKDGSTGNYTLGLSRIHVTNSFNTDILDHIRDQAISESINSCSFMLLERIKHKCKTRLHSPG